MWPATLKPGMWGFWLCCDPGHIPSPLRPLSLGRKRKVKLKERWPLSPPTFSLPPLPPPQNPYPSICREESGRIVPLALLCGFRQG